MCKNISKKEKKSYEIMRDTTRVGDSLLTNDNRWVFPGYLPVISHAYAHMIGF